MLNKNRIGNDIQCRKCNKIQHEINYSKDNRYNCGFATICKSCKANQNGVKHSRMKKVLSKGVVYLLKSNEFYKIGVTTRKIQKRLTKLQIGNPYIIEIIKEYKTDYSYYNEYSLHQKFKNKKFRGEWFILDNKDLGEIDKYFTLNP